MTVVPLLLKSVPPVMPVILKCVTSAPSTALRERTRPDVDCVSSGVVAVVAVGVSAIGFTVSTNVSLIVCVVPATVSVTVNVMVVVPN